MINQRIGRPSTPRADRRNPAWWIVPLGLAGCLLIGFVMGVRQSPMMAAAMLGAGISMAWVALVVARPEFALLIYTVLAVNLNSIDLPVPGGVRLSPDILLTSLLIVGVALRALTMRRPVFSLPITAPYLIFLAVPMVTMIWSPTPVESMKGIFRFVSYYAIMWLIVDVIQSKEQLRHMVVALLLAPIIPILTSFLQAATGGGQTIWAGELFNRVYGLAGGPFTLAYFLVLLIPLVLIFLLESSPEDAGSGVWQFRKGLLALLLVGAGAALLLTFIRGAWFALVFAVLLLGLLRGSLRYRQLLLTIPVVAGSVLLIFSPALDRLEQVADPTSTLFGRIEVWKLAVDWITTSPLAFLAGLGMKSFEYFYILQAAPRIAGLYWRREAFLIGNRPHNEILGFWLDVGLIGLIAFIASLVIVIRQAWRIFRRSDDQPLQLFALAFIIGSAGILFGAMGDNVFSQPSVASYFWIMAGLIMAITRHMMPAAVQDTAATP